MSFQTRGRAPQAHVILDSTLRDGEQAPGVSLSPEEKAEYVRLAEGAGVRYIEIGFPQNPFDFRACQAAAAAVRHSRVVAMAVTTEESIARVCEVGAHEVLLIVPCSDSHLKSVYGSPLEILIAQLRKSILYARECGLVVNIGLEDASQGDVRIIARLVEEARRYPGTVDCVTIADTRGQLLPHEAERLVGEVGAMLAGFNCRTAFHAHDDLGLATANSLAALSAPRPVDCVHVTCCGFGERAGNASLEQVAVVLTTKLGRETGLDLPTLGVLADFVQKAFLTPIHPHAPILGSKVFLHESGIHQKGMLSEKSSYQFLDPGMFGAQAGFILGKHSGRRLRAAIAAAAGCDEEAVLELQRRLVEENGDRLRDDFLRCLTFIRDCTFKGMTKDEAVNALKGE